MSKFQQKKKKKKNGQKQLILKKYIFISSEPNMKSFNETFKKDVIILKVTKMILEKAQGGQIDPQSF